jgi:hypothetical protein
MDGVSPLIKVEQWFVPWMGLCFGQYPGSKRVN